MEIDLMGRTVTQSMQLVREALAECSDSELVLKTDNEVVKLNLYNQLTKMGYPCGSERKGPHYFLRVRTGKKPTVSNPAGGLPAGGNATNGNSEPGSARQEKFAFPVSDENLNPSRPTRNRPAGAPASTSANRVAIEPTVEPLGPRSERPRSGSRRSLLSESEPNRVEMGSGAPTAGVPSAGVPSAGVPSAGVPTAGVPSAGAALPGMGLNEPDRSGKPLLNRQSVARPLTPAGAPPSQTPIAAAQAGIATNYTGAAGAQQGSWLIIQHEQIGERDSALGHQLMEELIQAINPPDTAGIFLLHRGARLLDPQLHQGRILRVLLQKNVPICVCKKSASFYGLEGKLPEEIQIVPAGVLLHISFQSKVIWL